MEEFFPKMNSLYQIRSKMLHGTKVIILVEKKVEKEVAWLGLELTTFILEVEVPTITPWILHGKSIFVLSIIKYN